MKFEIGDVVRVRDDLDKCRRTEMPSIVPEMLLLAGKEFVVSGESVTGWTLLNGEANIFKWNDKWLEPAFEVPDSAVTVESLSSIV